MSCGETGKGSQFFSRLLFGPWNIPQSIRYLLLSSSNKNLEPVTEPAAPQKVIEAISIPFISCKIEMHLELNQNMDK